MRFLGRVFQGIDSLFLFDIDSFSNPLLLLHFYLIFLSMGPN
jgi:hypothetical protein